MTLARVLLTAMATCLFAAGATAVDIDDVGSFTVASGFLDESGPDEIGCLVVANTSGTAIVCEAENSSDSLECATNAQNMIDAFNAATNSSKISFAVEDTDPSVCITVNVENRNIFP